MKDSLSRRLSTTAPVGAGRREFEVSTGRIVRLVQDRVVDRPRHVQVLADHVGDWLDLRHACGLGRPVAHRNLGNSEAFTQQLKQSVPSWLDRLPSAFAFDSVPRDSHMSRLTLRSRLEELEHFPRSQDNRLLITIGVVCGRCDDARKSPHAIQVYEHRAPRGPPLCL